jgi:DNA-binding GntR family transcriptional regulator
MVTPVTLRELHEVNETRMLIEIHAAKVVCAQRIPIAAQLRELLAEQRTLLKDDATRFIDADRSFHMALVTAAGNRVLSEVYGSLRDRQQRTGLAAVAARPGRASRVLRDHRAILTAVAAYDAAAAEEAIRAHLEQSLAELQQRLRG